MDSRLLTISFILLALELAVLLGDLGLLPYSIFQFQKEEIQNKQSLGHISQLSNNVRRKLEHSFIWEESEKKQELYSYDSILTLENSTAKVKLDGDINIKLYENTLIVIEPQDDAQKSDSSIHLKFAKGDLRSILKQKQLKLSSKNWNFTANKGSDVSFRSLQGEDLEIEVNRGSILLENKNEPDESYEVNSGSSLELSKEGIEKAYQKSAGLKWKEGSRKRVYTFSESKLVNLDWEGEATEIQITYPNKDKSKIELAKEDTSLNLDLKPGQYFVKLINDDQVSESMSLRVIPSPVVNYIFPFPRDRMISHNKNLFSWTPIENAKNYKVEFSRNNQFESIHESYMSKETNLKTDLKNRGPIYWRIIAIDEEGYPINGREHRLLYSISDALAAPVLKQLKKSRVPTSVDTKRQKKKKRFKKKNKKLKTIDTSLLFHMIDHLIPNVYAQDKTEEFLYEFQWEKVEGADFYIIEISSSNDFTSVIETDKADAKTIFQWKTKTTGEVYWRVAGGSNDGKMGFFSEAQKVDLSSIRVQPKKAKPKPKPKMAKKKLPKTLPVKLPPKLPIKAPPPPVAKKTEEKFEVLEVYEKPKEKTKKKKTKKDSKTHMSLQANLGYSKKKGKLLKDKTNSYTYEGLTPLSVNYKYGKFDPGKKTYSYLVEIDYYRSEWKAKDSSLLPFQSKVVENNAKLGVYLFNSENRIGGLYAKAKSLPERKGNEEIDFKTTGILGYSMYQLSKSDMQELDYYSYYFAIGTGSLYSEIEGKVTAYWDLLETKEYKMKFINSLGFELGIDHDSEKSSHSLEFWMGLKIDWNFSSSKKEE